MGSLRKSSFPLSVSDSNANKSEFKGLYYGAMAEFNCVTEENSDTRCCLNTEISEPDFWPPCHLE